MHFPNGAAPEDQDVLVTGKAIQADLEQLLADIKEQNSVLDACLVQLDQYQQVKLSF